MKNNLPSVPTLFEGGLFSDRRGHVKYVNGFSFDHVKRFYTVVNKFTPMVRAWHAHKHEAKYVTVTRGVAVIGCVKIDDFKSPSPNMPVHLYHVDAARPSVVYVPAGYANGFMNLVAETEVTFYATSSLVESKGDDYRYPPTYYNVWDLTGKKKIYYE